MRPGVARNYLKEVAEDFEEYAAEKYIPALSTPEADADTLLAGVSFVATRKVAGHESRLREILTTRLRGKVGQQIETACVDALIATTDDPVATARFLALVATQRNPSSASKSCEVGLKRLGESACEALLRELAGRHQSLRIRRLAALLTRIARVPSPEPPATWVRAGPEDRRQAVDKWRARLIAAGVLEPASRDAAESSWPATSRPSQDVR
ncbi:MAG: hypothetical protein ACYSUQ_01205 [Planctomycetota bacterium]|jgi:hypothetical protein